MSSIRTERIKELLHDLGARFLSQNGNTSSLLTVTSVEMSKDKKHVTILFTVFPAKSTPDGLIARPDEVGFRDNLEKTALEFAKRKRSDFKQFVKDNSRIGYIPQLDFEIDFGEKNRQKIDRLLNQ